MQSHPSSSPLSSLLPPPPHKVTIDNGGCDGGVGGRGDGGGEGGCHGGGGSTIHITVAELDVIMRGDGEHYKGTV